MNVIDEFLRQAEAQPQKTALQGPVRALSYGELAKLAGRVAGALVQGGLKRGDTVAIKSKGIELIAATLGVAWAGGVAVSFSGLPDGSAPQFAKLCGVKFMIEKVAQLVAAGAPAVPVADCGAGDVWRIGFSSGTTGERKAMTFTHGDSIAKSSLLSTVPGIQGERTLLNLGAALTFAVAYWMRELSRGGAVLIRFEGVEALDAMDRYGVDLVVSSPGNALRLMQAAKSRAGGIPKIRTLMLGGAAVTAAQRRLIRAEFCEDLWINYGATEVGMVALLGPALMDAHPDCAGRLMPWVEAQITEGGLLRLRSPMMASGYLLRDDSPEWDRHAFDGGWFQSRDRARIDADGLVFLTSREDDVINIGGNKLEPRSVEAVIEEVAGVVESAVLPVETEQGSQLLVGFVVAEGGIDKASLRAHCSARLDGWKVPGLFVQLDELPRNDAGKVMRAQLAKRIRVRAK